MLVTQLTAFVTWVTSLQRNPEFIAWMADAQNWLSQFIPNIDLSTTFNGILSWLADPNNLSNIGGGVIDLGFTIINGVVSVFIVLVLTIYFTASLPSVREGIARLVPMTKRDLFNDISGQMIDSVGRYVSGLITLVTINGTLAFIVLSIIQAPFPILLAVISAIGVVIPLVGPISASAVIILFTWLIGGPVPGLIAAIWFLIYMQIEAYVISPRIYGKAVKLPAIIILISVIAGGALMGLLGALVAIPVAASIMIVVEQLYLPKQDLR